MAAMWTTTTQAQHVLTQVKTTNVQQHVSTQWVAPCMVWTKPSSMLPNAQLWLSKRISFLVLPQSTGTACSNSGMISSPRWNWPQTFYNYTNRIQRSQPTNKSMANLTTAKRLWRFWAPKDGVQWSSNPCQSWLMIVDLSLERKLSM